MATIVDRPGSFRCEITEYGTKKADSGAVAVTLKCRLLEFYHEEAWHPWEEYDMECYADMWIIKKDGSINDTACQSLIKNAGWDGDLAAFATRTWSPTKCQIRVEPNEYQGKTTFRGSFINAWDSVPGGMSSLDANELKALSVKHGGALRAIAGTIKQNSAKPNGKPAAPPKAANTTVAPSGDAPPEDEIPF